MASVALALGALAAGLLSLLLRAGISLATGTRLLFALYVAAGLAVAAPTARLSPQVEMRPAAAAGTAPRVLFPPLGRLRGIVRRLAALFSVNALAGGLTVQSLMVLYFHLRFGVALATLGALFFGANVCSALSFLAAARPARRFGLLNTMVFSHLPSNVLLVLLPLMSVFPLAAAVLPLRQSLSQMDVPTRQAYTMALVAPEVHTAAASVTSLARSAGSATSPVIPGLLLQGALLTFGVPFLLAGGLKAAHDLTLWRVFRRVRLPSPA